MSLRNLALGSILLATGALAFARPAPADELLPTGFVFQQVGYGPFLNWGPSSFAFLPDRRLVMIELVTGRVLLNAVGATSSALIYTIPNVWFDGERGLLGVAVDPGWPARPYLYFYFSHNSSFGYLIMLRASGDLTNPSSTNIVLSNRYDLLTDLPDQWIDHNGGTLRFGPDGKLYLSLGDDGVDCSAQDLSILTGKILRLNISSMPGVGPGPPPHSALVPPDNPYVNLGANQGLVWAWGFRNPFRFTIDSPTGDLYIGDVGTITWEEVDIAPRTPPIGPNFGWPQFEGPDSTHIASTCGQGNTFSAPVYAYPHFGATAIVCGPLYRPVPGSPVSFPAAYNGSLFIVEHFAGWIRRLVKTGSTWSVAAPVPGQPSAQNWAEGIDAYSDFQLGPDGALYLAHLHTTTSTPQGVFRIVSDHLASPAPEPDGKRPSTAAVFVFPNPGSVGAGATFRWNVTSPGRQSLQIFDGVGRVVLTRDLQTSSESSVDVPWDGRSDAGTPVTAGVYFYKIEDPAGRVLRGKVTMVR